MKPGTAAKSFLVPSGGGLPRPGPMVTPLLQRQEGAGPLIRAD